MNLDFDMSLAKRYNSNSQITRVLTEDWFARNMYCPICGKQTIQKVKANAPVKDYICENCKSQYELKSKRVNTDSFQSIVADGEYTTMINRITSLDNPSFFFMHYDKYRVNNLIIVPKCFFYSYNYKGIEAKIRQQLQCLRDKGIIEFKGNGKYRRI